MSAEYMTKELKRQVVELVIGNPSNTGAPQAQIALLTYRIRRLTEHLRKHPKDYRTLLALKMMVGRRRRLLRYLARKDYNSYQELVAKLGLRG